MRPRGQRFDAARLTCRSPSQTIDHRRDFRAAAIPVCAVLGGGGEISSTANGDVQLLIDQSQRLREVYDGRRSDADSTATQLLTASIGLVTLTITGTVIGPSTPAAGKGFALGFALAVTVAGALSTFLAVWARSISGLRSAPAIELSGHIKGRYVVKDKPEKNDYLQEDVVCLRGSSPLSHESTAFHIARAELDFLEGIDDPSADIPRRSTEQGPAALARPRG